ncbi:MAG: glutathione binding-like protein [Thiotrichaceae bacterium]
MIDFYTADTPNGDRVELTLNELGIVYRKHVLSLSSGDNYKTAFLKLNPSARIPVIVDHDQLHDGKPLTLTQSASILLHLAEKEGKLIPFDKTSRAKALEWLFFDATDTATTHFNAFYLGINNHTKASLVLKSRIMKYYAVYDQHLSSSAYLAGDEYSIADIAAYPWAKTIEPPEMKKLHHLQRWINEIGQRTCVKNHYE